MRRAAITPYPNTPPYFPREASVFRFLSSLRGNTKPHSPAGFTYGKNLTCYPHSLGYFLDYNLTSLWSLNVHIGKRTGKLWFRRESNPHGHFCPRDFERGFGFEPNSVPHYLVFGGESRKSPLCLPFHHWTFLSYTANIQKRINKSNRNVSVRKINIATNINCLICSWKKMTMKINCWIVFFATQEIKLWS